MSKYESDFPPVICYQQRELEKSLFIKDKKKRLEFMLKIEQEIKDKNFKEIIPTMTKTMRSGEKIEIPLFSVAHVKDRINKERGLFYGTIWSAKKRTLQLEIYLDDIFETAKKQGDKEKKAAYLIDERYKYHIGIFSDEPLKDEAYRTEYNEYIADKIRDKLVEINGTATNEIKEIVLQKRLQWNATKNGLGTLFGVLINEGIISGTKADIQRMIQSYFLDKNRKPFTKEYLKKNIELHESDGKFNYSTKVEIAIKSLIVELKSQLKK